MRKEPHPYDIPYPVSDDYLRIHKLSRENLETMVFGKKKIRVIYIRNDDPALFKECCKLFVNDIRKEDRHLRCRFLSPAGNYARCSKDCNECMNIHRNTEVSLDALMEDYQYEGPPIEDDIFKDIIDRATFESVLKKVAEVNPYYAHLLKAIVSGMSYRSIAKKENKSVSTIAERANKAVALASKIYEGE